MFILNLLLEIVLLALGALVIWLNVNDIASYLSAGQDAPFWPFFWILLILSIFLGRAATR